MRIYLTARWARRDEMKLHRQELQKLGHEVTSRWLDEVDGVSPADAAAVDLNDIDDAEALIVFTDAPDVGYSTGGRHVEMGYAIGIGRHICVIGPRENVFHHLPQMNFVESVAKAAEFLLHVV